MRPSTTLAAVVALALAAGCSVSHRSGDFTCNDQQRCADGRTCVDGLCVLASDAGVLATCPSQCTSCELAQRSCTIDCAPNTGSATSTRWNW